MIKIGEVKGPNTPQIEKTQKDYNRPEKTSQFRKEMNSLEELSLREKLDTLLRQIDKQSDRLSKKIEIKEVLLYKKLIKEFLYESVNGMVEYSRDGFLDKRGRHRVQAIIKKVDNELETITRDVLKNEKDNLDILKKIEDIRGLILDIYM